MGDLYKLKSLKRAKKYATGFDIDGLKGILEKKEILEAKEFFININVEFSDRKSKIIEKKYSYYLHREEEVVTIPIKKLEHIKLGQIKIFYGDINFYFCYNREREATTDEERSKTIVLLYNELKVAQYIWVEDIAFTSSVLFDDRNFNIAGRMSSHALAKAIEQWKRQHTNSFFTLKYSE